MCTFCSVFLLQGSNNVIQCLGRFLCFSFLFCWRSWVGLVHCQVVRELALLRPEMHDFLWPVCFRGYSSSLYCTKQLIGKECLELSIEYHFWRDAIWTKGLLTGRHLYCFLQCFCKDADMQNLRLSQSRLRQSFRAFSYNASWLLREVQIKRRNQSILASIWVDKKNQK